MDEWRVDPEFGGQEVVSNTIRVTCYACHRGWHLKRILVPAVPPGRTPQA
jgi:hypothetical protein